MGGREALFPFKFVVFIVFLLVVSVCSWYYDIILSSTKSAIQPLRSSLSRLLIPSETVRIFGNDGATRSAFLNAQSLRLLIWVMTTKENHQKKAIHVKKTWGKHADRLLFISDEDDKALPAVGIHGIHGREHLTLKTMRAFQYIYEHHLNDADWFMKADDDTFVIVENLRFMLSRHDTSKPVFFGSKFEYILKTGYFSGGSGYVLSKEALKRFGTRKANLCAKDGGSEDVKIAKCLTSLGVQVGDSNDANGRSLFHVYMPNIHVTGSHPPWFKSYKGKSLQTGLENMSNYPVSFHYVSPQSMYDIYFFVYHTRLYGIKDISTNKTT